MLRVFAWGKTFDWFQRLTGFRLCATTSIPTTLNNMQQGVQNETVLGVVGQQCCVHLQRSFVDQSYSVKKSTNNVKISLINQREHKKTKRVTDEKMMTVQ